MRESGTVLACRPSDAPGRCVRRALRRYSVAVFIVMTAMFMAGCGHFDEARQVREAFAEANDLSRQGNYTASLDRYGRIIEAYPAAADRGLFEMGIVYAHPKNREKDYQRSLGCFQRLVTEYPASEYRQNSETMIFTITNTALKDATIAGQQTQIDTLRQAANVRQQEIAALQKMNEALEQKVFSYAVRLGSVDRVLIEKGARRLTLLSRGDALKTYRIALGGNPVGPKERQGDNKTPEGVYTIDARNKNSRFHLSLHVSYPNEKDRRRARDLGVSPGGDIMIHGIKNGFSWVGDAHAEVDWTKGCIAVTDQEIEEIGSLVPNGTTVEIRP